MISDLTCIGCTDLFPFRLIVYTSVPTSLHFVVSCILVLTLYAFIAVIMSLCTKMVDWLVEAALIYNILT